MTRVRPLPWDTSFFGRKIGMLQLTAADGAIPPNLSKLDIECVYVEIPLTAPRALEDWIRRGARLVDVRAELEADLERLSTAAIPQEVEMAAFWNESDRAAALSLMDDLSSWSRFASDARFADLARPLYHQWMERVFRGEHRALVWRENGTIVALLTYDLQGAEARVELLAVHPKGRGNGIGGALVRAFLVHAREGGHKCARVRTQLRNLGALRTYQGSGFQLLSSTLVLHWWADEHTNS